MYELYIVMSKLYKEILQVIPLDEDPLSDTTFWAVTSQLMDVQSMQMCRAYLARKSIWVLISLELYVARRNGLRCC